MTAQGVTAVTGSETAGTVVNVAVPLAAGVGGGIMIARQQAAQRATTVTASGHGRGRDGRDGGRRSSSTNPLPMEQCRTPSCC